MAPIESRIKQLEIEGKTVVLIALNGELAGYLAIADQIKVTEENEKDRKGN